MNKEEIEKETKTFFVEPYSITNSEFLEKLEMQNKIDKLQKENEELKEGLNFRVNYCKKLEQELYGGEFEETLVEKKYFVSKDKLLEVLRIDKDEEEHIYNTEERILNLIDTILEEVERLEDIEDKMLLKCVSKDKIKAKIKVFKKEGSQTSLIIASVLEELLEE